MLRSAIVVAAALVATCPVGAQTIASSQLPANGNYQTVGTDAATGFPIVETTDPSIMTFGKYPYGWHANGVFGSTAGIAAPPQQDQNYNVSSTGTMATPNAAPPVGANAGVAGMTPAQSAAAAWAADPGCAVALCMGGENQVQSAAECSIIMNNLAALQKMGQQPAACKNSSYSYAPPTCATPWRLYDRGGWQNYSCRAVLQQSYVAYQNAVNTANQLQEIQTTCDGNGNCASTGGYQTEVIQGNNTTGGYCYTYFNPAYWYVVNITTADVYEFHNDGSMTVLCAGYVWLTPGDSASTNGGTGGAGGD